MVGVGVGVGGVEVAHDRLDGLVFRYGGMGKAHVGGSRVLEDVAHLDRHALGSADGSIGNRDGQIIDAILICVRRVLEIGRVDEGKLSRRYVQGKQSCVRPGLGVE